MTKRDRSRSLDTTLREFESGGFRVRVQKRATWITIKGRGGNLTMSLEEVADVIAVLECAADYLRDQEGRDGAKTSE